MGYVVLVVIMAVVIFALLFKIYTLRRACREIRDAFDDRLAAGTNTLIDTSSRDRCVRELADGINVQLRELRAQRHRFVQGDAELKNAVMNISHDLRTPLTAICGYLDLLEQEERSETAKRYLDVIRDRSEILVQMTEELFRYSVILSGESGTAKEPVVIGSVLEESIAAFYTALRERGISPVVRMPEQKVVRYLDRGALVRVFSNLLGNAVKYSEGGLEICLYETGEIVFANSAPALDKVQVGRLFDRFYTVEAASSSTGLGLSIARTLVERMGGEIFAEYENGRLEISIRFPEGK